MHYDPFTSVDNIFKKVEDLLEYGDMLNCPYSHHQSILNAYNIINKTGKFKESIKSQNRFPQIHKMWIAFKTHFCEDHQLLTEIGEFPLEKSGYRQAKLVEDIVMRFSVKFKHQANMVNSPPHQISSTTNCNSNYRNYAASSRSESISDMNSFR